MGRGRTMTATLADTACHEAGHAVMRWLVGLPATAIHVYAEGEGLCEGTGRRIVTAAHLSVLLSSNVNFRKRAGDEGRG